MKKVFTSLLTIALLFSSLLGLNGCSAEEIVVGYTIYPIGYLLQQIAGESIESVDLSDQVNPIQVAQVASNFDASIDKVNLILKVGDIEPYWEIYENDIKETESEIVDLSTLAAIYSFKRYTSGVVSGNNIVVESDYYDSDLFAFTDMYEMDLGLWLSPIAMTAMARSIKDILISKDPTNTAFYTDNFNALEANLIRMDSEYSSLSSMDLKLVTMTPSFGCWQKEYNVGIYPLILSKYGALPTDAQLQVIMDRIEEDDVQYIVYESNMTEEMKELYDKVKSECDLEEVKLSNLSNLTEDEINANKDYLTIMYDNLTTLESLDQGD